MMKFPSIFKLSATNKEAAVTKKDKRIISRVIKRQESITRRDIADWKTARLEATRAEEPRQHLLQVLYDEVMLDAKMTSQIGLRIDKSQAASFSLKKGDMVDEESTKILQDSGLYDTFSEEIILANFYNHSLCEFSFDKGKPVVNTIPRKHVSPEDGIFYPDVYGDGEKYRDRPDFGTFILEFYPKKGDLGLLNKAVPYVLMKKFALSCWSELCEIYGIPPRVMKTDTQDPTMLERAEPMMKQIGAAAWFIIDTSEDFEFAQSTSTNGDVYKNFISVCDEHISLLNLGAVIGQDTLNGNRSKEETSVRLLDAIVEADKRKIQFNFNQKIIPALESLGILPQGLRFEFAQAVDIDKLWKMVFEGSQYYTFDIEWLKDTFGMNITGMKSNEMPPELRGKVFDFFA